MSTYEESQKSVELGASPNGGLVATVDSCALGGPPSVSSVSLAMITSAEEFVRLRESTNPDDYNRAAAEEASIEVWREIIASRPDMRVWVVLNKTVPLELLEELAGAPEVEVRDSVARKRKITEATALRLANDKDETVRAALARNPKISDSILGILSLDASRLVQGALADRRKNG